MAFPSCMTVLGDTPQNKAFGWANQSSLEKGDKMHSTDLTQACAFQTTLLTHESTQEKQAEEPCVTAKQCRPKAAALPELAEGCEDMV